MPNFCTHLVPPLNGQMNSSDRTIGSTVSFSCSIGFVLSSNETRICQQNHNWSRLTPSCEGKRKGEHLRCWIDRMFCSFWQILLPLDIATKFVIFTETTNENFVQKFSVSAFVEETSRVKNKTVNRFPTQVELPKISSKFRFRTFPTCKCKFSHIYTTNTAMRTRHIRTQELNTTLNTSCAHTTRVLDTPSWNLFWWFVLKFCSLFLPLKIRPKKAEIRQLFASVDVFRISEFLCCSHFAFTRSNQ